jgi:hypothetical protein
MPGIAHEAVVEVLQNEPTLVATLLRDIGIRLPTDLAPVIADSNLSVRDPDRKKQYTADNVFVFQSEAGKKVVVIVEVQSEAPDHSRILAWPAYACVARNKHDCDVSFMAFGLTEEAVQGCSKAIKTGHRGFNLKPYTTGHGLLRPITQRFAPELAVLHVVTQTTDMTAMEAQIRILEALAVAPPDRRASYSRIVRAVVSDTVRADLEQLMKTVIKDPFIDGLIEEGMARGIEKGQAIGEAKGQAIGEAKGQAIGEAKGEANALLLVLAARQLEVTAAERERIMGCTDLTQLSDWITRATTAPRVADLFT